MKKLVCFMYENSNILKLSMCHTSSMKRYKVKGYKKACLLYLITENKYIRQYSALQT